MTLSCCSVQLNTMGLQYFMNLEQKNRQVIYFTKIGSNLVLHVVLTLPQYMLIYHHAPRAQFVRNILDSDFVQSLCKLCFTLETKEDLGFKWTEYGLHGFQDCPYFTKCKDKEGKL